MDAVNLEINDGPGSDIESVSMDMSELFTLSRHILIRDDESHRVVFNLKRADMGVPLQNYSVFATEELSNNSLG
ncbi:uncharacterized protein N7496_010746 [Penicillium cataractarum]|uniref:Uncharacterized protein n=1 Tax=Penicillium cataractarum TaxID=2100454 RepID=A0A9W9RIT5_9EURO|nr:uncharacterized protein N7496_010746 [Penicillium cataractarum]KAJ5358333.1 hypothetical protein N7496_010746 [Penicillium cataractarum]